MASRHVDDYDDDGLDEEYGGDYHGEEEEGLSPEDQVAMAQGTSEVQQALGQDSSKVTTKQIQDALWHYYYDVDKSVAYLNKTYIAPPPAPKPTPKKAAPEGMFSIFSYPDLSIPAFEESWADHQRSTLPGRRLCHSPSSWSSSANGFPIMALPQPPLSTYFSDMPWLNIPENRRTVFIAPDRPRGGLLGGGEGPPMTKLQKLAAARKKKSDEKKEKNKLEATDHGISNLSISEEVKKENQDPQGPLAKRQKVTAKVDVLQSNQRALVQDREDAASESLLATSAPPPQPAVGHTILEDDNTPMTKKASPSAFARTLFGSAPDPSKNKTRDIFAMPYASSSAYSSGPFAEPSPDDVVLAAQAKGSNFARKS